MANSADSFTIFLISLSIDFKSSSLACFPVNKIELTRAILANRINLEKIVKIIHLEIRKKMSNFIK